MNYIEAIGIGFPGVECHAVGDGSVYEDIVWENGLPLPSKDTLDTWLASNNNTTTTTTKITVLAFRNRFTQTENVAIEIAALDDPSAPMTQRQVSAAVRSMLKDVSVATFIDLSRADLRAGVQMMEQYGILAQGRSSIIVDTPPSTTEIPLQGY